MLSIWHRERLRTQRRRGEQHRRGGRSIPPVRLYGLALYTVNEIIDWYSTREEAEEAVRHVIADEPGLAGIVGVETIELEIARKEGLTK
jgi:hypothetical protein